MGDRPCEDSISDVCVWTLRSVCLSSPREGWRGGRPLPVPALYPCHHLEVSLQQVSLNSGLSIAAILYPCTRTSTCIYFMLISLTIALREPSLGTLDRLWGAGQRVLHQHVTGQELLEEETGGGGAGGGDQQSDDNANKIGMYNARSHNTTPDVEPAARLPSFIPQTVQERPGNSSISLRVWEEMGCRQ